MDALFLVGRILVGVFYLMNALNHFRNVDMMSGYAASKGVPAPRAMVQLTGLMLLVGGLSILLGAYPTLGVAVVVVFLVVVAFWMHNFWTVQDPMQRMGEMVNFGGPLGGGSGSDVQAMGRGSPGTVVDAGPAASWFPAVPGSHLAAGDGARSPACPSGSGLPVVVPQVGAAL